MAFTNYTALKVSAVNWLKRSGITGISDSADMIPEFITIGEEELSRKLRVSDMEATGTLTCVAGTATITLPSNFRAFKWLYVTGTPKQKLGYMSGDMLHEKYAGNSNGKPVAFSYQGGNLLLGPTPDSGYTISYLAYIAPLALSGSQLTNTLFPRYGSLYLYAALKAAFGFLEDDVQVKKYDTLLTNGIADAKKEDVMDRHSGGLIRAVPGGFAP